MKEHEFKGGAVEVSDLQPGDVIQNDVGEPVTVVAVHNNLRTVRVVGDDDIEVPEGVKVWRLATG